MGEGLRCSSLRIFGSVLRSFTLGMDDDDAGQDFTADLVLEVLSGEEGAIVLDGTDANSAYENGTVVLDATGSGTEDDGDDVLLESQKIARLKDTEKNRALF